MTINTPQNAYSIGGGSVTVNNIILQPSDPGTANINFPLKQLWINTLTNAIWQLVQFSSATGIVEATWRSIGPIVIEDRDPSSTDYQYPLGQLWVNPLTEGLFGLTSNPTSTTGNWESLTGVSSGTVSFLAGNDSIEVGPNGSGVINVVGDGSVITVTNSAANTEQVAITGVVPVNHGGTGTNTLTGIVVANGTSNFTASPVTEFETLLAAAGNTVTGLGVASDGQIIIGSTGASPVLSVLTPGTNITITNGPGSVTINSTASGSGFISVVIQTFSVTGTYTPTASMAYCIIEVVGGGGGGGNAPSVSGQYGGGSGGGGGFYNRAIFSAGTVGASQTVTIGSGGASEANGSQSSVGTLITASGGSAGVSIGPFAGSVTEGAAGGVGGATGTGGTFGFPGSDGAAVYVGTTAGMIISGSGGSTYFGGTTPGLFIIASGSNQSTNGNAGVNYGAGGSGALTFNTAAAATGGHGASGVVVITEYIT